ncbi:hypothetical protein GCM10020221_33780 [Streptomyces thioluteus]|uniref:Uncharacterized protein n=1 Tax=Streptomyces thioluteus TaxID=66431 RepID=A0ABN3X239_STRTU
MGASARTWPLVPPWPAPLLSPTDSGLPGSSPETIATAPIATAAEAPSSPVRAGAFVLADALAGGLTEVFLVGALVEVLAEAFLVGALAVVPAAAAAAAGAGAGAGSGGFRGCGAPSGSRSLRTGRCGLRCRPVPGRRSGVGGDDGDRDGGCFGGVEVFGRLARQGFPGRPGAGCRFIGGQGGRASMATHPLPSYAFGVSVHHSYGGVFSSPLTRAGCG